MCGIKKNTSFAKRAKNILKFCPGSNHCVTVKKAMDKLKRKVLLWFMQKRNFTGWYLVDIGSFCKQITSLFENFWFKKGNTNPHRQTIATVDPDALVLRFSHSVCVYHPVRKYRYPITSDQQLFDTGGKFCHRFNPTGRRHRGSISRSYWCITCDIQHGAWCGATLECPMLQQVVIHQ